ncbi:MAG: cysteine desulfurase NifS [Krumholzibacteria bacterium]|nr:cysteine desulfurase NifS [Candidatus Krumholzibacteria bacterium]
MEGLPERPAGGVYMDNNATTAVAPEVVAAMLPFLAEHYGNPSSMHGFGAKAGEAVAAAREQVRALLGAELPSEIVLTSGGSESDNLAIVGTLHAHPDKRHIVTTAVEHPAVLGLCRELEKRHGCEVTYLGVDERGNLDLDELAGAIRPDTAIVSVMMANNETGVLFDTAAVGRIVKDKGAVFHVDAVQAAGKLPLDLGELATVDLLSLSGHKLHAAKGIGALYVRKGTKIRPLIVGGHQERGRRAGTENVAGAAGLGAACELARAHLADEHTAVRVLRDRLETRLLERIPDSRLNGDPLRRLPNTTNISFEYIEGEGILLLLDRTGVAASSGSACTSGSLEPSHVLRAMGIPFTRAHGSIRFSLSRYNTMDQVDYVAEVLPVIVERLRRITPFSAQRATF